MNFNFLISFNNCFQGWCLQYSNYLGRTLLLLQSNSAEGLIFGSNLLSTTIQLPQNAAANEQYLDQSLQLDVEEVSSVF